MPSHLLHMTSDDCVEEGPRRNPLVKIAADAAEDMLAYASPFGLTPAARGAVAA
jgi:phage terminase small subunit